MKRAFAAPKDLLDRKPPHGAPCTRCGLCCMASLCPLAQHIFERPEHPGPCPALLHDGDGFTCGVVECAPSPEHRAAALLLIGSGTGCDARFNGEAINKSFYLRLLEWDRLNTGEIAKAKKLWGAS